MSLSTGPMCELPWSVGKALAVLASYSSHKTISFWIKTHTQITASVICVAQKLHWCLAMTCIRAQWLSKTREARGVNRNSHPKRNSETGIGFTLACKWDLALCDHCFVVTVLWSLQQGLEYFALIWSSRTFTGCRTPGQIICRQWTLRVRGVAWGFSANREAQTRGKCLSLSFFPAWFINWVHCWVVIWGPWSPLIWQGV